MSSIGNTTLSSIGNTTLSSSGNATSSSAIFGGAMESVLEMGSKYYTGAEAGANMIWSRLKPLCNWAVEFIKLSQDLAEFMFRLSHVKQFINKLVTEPQYKEITLCSLTPLIDTVNAVQLWVLRDVVVYLKSPEKSFEATKTALENKDTGGDKSGGWWDYLKNGKFISEKEKQGLLADISQRQGWMLQDATWYSNELRRASDLMYQSFSVCQSELQTQMFSRLTLEIARLKNPSLRSDASTRNPRNPDHALLTDDEWTTKQALASGNAARVEDTMQKKINDDIAKMVEEYAKIVNLPNTMEINKKLRELVIGINWNLEAAETIREIRGILEGALIVDSEENKKKRREIESNIVKSITKEQSRKLEQFNFDFLENSVRDPEGNKYEMCNKKPRRWDLCPACFRDIEEEKGIRKTVFKKFTTHDALALRYMRAKARILGREECDMELNKDYYYCSKFATNELGDMNDLLFKTFQQCYQTAENNGIPDMSKDAVCQMVPKTKFWNKSAANDVLVYEPLTITWVLTLFAQIFGGAFSDDSTGDDPSNEFSDAPEFPPNSDI